MCNDGVRCNNDGNRMGHGTPTFEAVDHVTLRSDLVGDTFRVCLTPAAARAANAERVVNYIPPEIEAMAQLEDRRLVAAIHWAKRALGGRVKSVTGRQQPK